MGGKDPECLDVLLSHKASSLKTRHMITFFKENSILIHPMVDWRKGKMSYEEASAYFSDGGTYLGCRSASLEEKMFSMKNLLTEQLLQYADAIADAQHGRQATLLMIDGGPGEGMPDQLPIPIEEVPLKLCFI